MGVDLLEEAARRIDAGDPRSARGLAERAYEASRRSGSPETRWRAGHEGSTYSATAPALAFVRRLAEDERVPGRVDLIRFLDVARA